MAESTTVSLPDIELFKQQALQWANRFHVVCLLDSNQYPHKTSRSKEWMLAIDAVDEITSSEDSFQQLKAFHEQAGSTIFGFLSYDLKNQTEQLESKNRDDLKFPELFFFKPRYIFEITENKLTVNRNYPETFELIEVIRRETLDFKQKTLATTLRTRTSKEVYLKNIEEIRVQIEAGDFYELNYCNEFYAEGAAIQPVQTFLELNEKAKAPFSSFFKLDDKYLLCASPERFMKKEASKLISQPIKGTIGKGETEEQNQVLKAQLQNDLKEQAENVMIVDLVRNDLARSSKAGTVKVEELFGVYEFNTVNQMISTVSAEMEEGLHFTNALRNAFPMGSMTGSPKVEVMKNIERYEDFKRGLYSGSVGYITAQGDFDFNVVIRSIFYNATQKYLSVRVGGAITYDSIAEKEWDEILLKAKSMMDVLQMAIAE